MTEKWLPIPGWEGLYEVSDHGRVRSLPRVRNTRWGPRLMGKTRLLKQSSTRTPGYFTVPLTRNAATKVHLVHRLVAMAWLPAPEPDQSLCRHLDDNPLNNHASNLAWGTASDNMRDAVRNGGNHNTRKTHCPKGHPYSGKNLAFQREGNWGRKCRACARDKARRERREAAQRRANCGAPTAAGTPCKRPSPCYLHNELTAAAAQQQAA